MRWTGTFDPCASWTMRMILASAVSLPTFVARNLKAPVLLIVAPMTSSPTFFSTGRDSPVTIDSSTAEEPSISSPSPGIFSPLRPELHGQAKNHERGDHHGDVVIHLGEL